MMLSERSQTQRPRDTWLTLLHEEPRAGRPGKTGSGLVVTRGQEGAWG